MIKNKIFNKIYTTKNSTLIVIDANVLIKDFWWVSLEYQEIMNWQFLGHTPILTEVTLGEAINALRNRADQLLLAISNNPNQRNLDKYNRLFNRKKRSLTNLEKAEDLIKRYEAFVRRLVTYFKGYIVSYPNVSLDLITQRSLKRIKPFNAGDKGFRDTLLWFNILELAEEHHCVSFISQNTNDFSDSFNNLHPSLLKEVQGKIPRYFEFFYFKNFKEFLTQFSNAQAIKEDLISYALYSNTLYGIDIEKWLEDNLIGLINQIELDYVAWTSIPAWAEAPRIRTVKEILSLSFNWINLKDKQIEFYLEVSLIGNFDCVVFGGFPKEIDYLKQVVHYSKAVERSMPSSCLLCSEGKFLIYFSFDLEIRKINQVEIIYIEDKIQEARDILQEIILEGD